MEGNNGSSIVDDNLSPIPPDRERIVILDAGAQYGKVYQHFKAVFIQFMLFLNELTGD